MNSFDYKKRKRFEGSHFIGTLLLTIGSIVGILFIFIDFNPPFNNMLPLIICLWIIGVMMIFTYSGIEINFTKNAFREYIFFCGLRFGEWSSLPPISKIKLKSSTSKTINFKNGISPTMSGTVKDYRVILYANQPTPLLSFSYNKKEVGLKNAELLGVSLKAIVEVE